MTHIFRFPQTFISLLALSTAAVSVGCVSQLEEGGQVEDEFLGQATFELKTVPTGVSCIRISVVGATTVTKDFGTLAVGAPTASLNMDRLPLGNVSISANAYAASTSATACNTSSAPTWIADAATALLKPGVVSKLDLTFRKNNPVTVSANFVGNIQALSMRHAGALLLIDGQVYQWGTLSTEQVIVAPTPVTGMSNVIAIAAGTLSACAVKSDGTLWCWGSSGNLGMGSTPTQLGAGRVYSQVEQGSDGVCAKSGDATYCWGANADGQLGSATPVVTVGAPVVITNAALVKMSGRFSCLIAADLDVQCAGQNTSGQLGRSGSSSFVWMDAPDSAPAVDLAVGYSHTLVVMADGSVQSTGANAAGQLGNGTLVGASDLAPVPGLTTVVAVSAGYAHSLALCADGSVKAWGANGFGQLGDASNVQRTTPVTVVGLPPARLIGTSAQASCAVTQNERVYCWGMNTDGQLGVGDKFDTATPKQVPINL